MKKEITISEFEKEIANETPWIQVDLNKWLNVDSLSPLKIYFQADEIRVWTKYPNGILLKCGDKASVCIHEIKKITQQNKKEVCDYDIVCGLPNGEDKVTLRLTRTLHKK